MKAKRDKLDEVFSLLIRTRDRWTCQRCGKVYPEGSQALHCSHFVSRRHMATRFDPGNCAAHCYSCHSYLEDHPQLFCEWLEGYMGLEALGQLRQRARQIVTLHKATRADMLKHYRRELTLLQASQAMVRPYEIEAYRV